MLDSVRNNHSNLPTLPSNASEEFIKGAEWALGEQIKSYLVTLHLYPNNIKRSIILNYSASDLLETNFNTRILSDSYKVLAELEFHFTNLEIADIKQF